MEWVINIFTQFLDIGKMMDEFEREFQKLREEVRNVKEKLNQRQDLIKKMTEKSAQSISKLSFQIIIVSTQKFNWEDAGWLLWTDVDTQVLVETEKEEIWRGRISK